MDVEKLVSKYIKIAERSGDEANVLCPFHADTKPSFSLNLATGLWKCHNPECPGSEGGHIAALMAYLEGVDEGTAQQKIEELKVELAAPPQKTPKKKACPYSLTDVEAWHSTLISNPDLLSTLAKSCSWTPETIVKFKLGWMNGRVMIPIIDKDGIIVNVRQYKPYASSGEPKVIGVSGCNSAALWPETNLQGETIYIMEGEKDCILANQCGLNAVTATSGAGTFLTEWINYFQEKNVIIVYDIDEAGRKGAKRVLSLLSTVAHSVKNIALPITSPDNGDFTDFIQQGHTVEGLPALAEAPAEVENERYSVLVPDEVLVTTISQALYGRLYFRRVRVRCRVTGNVNAPYMIPHVVRIVCNKGAKKHCLGCPNYNPAGEQKIVVSERNVELLNLIDCNDKAQQAALLRLAGIPSLCRHHRMQYETQQFVEEIYVTPMVDDQDSYQDFKMRPMYMLNIHMETNQDYSIEALIVKHPSTQELVFIGYYAEQCESSIEQFLLTDEIKEMCQIWTVSMPNLTPSTEISNGMLLTSMLDGTSTLPST